MATERARDQLVKLVTLYHDYKKNFKYLVYFDAADKSGSGGELRMKVTDGAEVWCQALNDDAFLDRVEKQAPGITVGLLAAHLLAALKEDKYAIAKVLDFKDSVHADADDEVIEFRTEPVEAAFPSGGTRKIQLKFALEPAKSSAGEIRGLLFSLYDKLSKSQDELKRYAGSSAPTPVRSQSSGGDADSKQQTGSAGGDEVRRFNVAAAHPSITRKVGMSIINPFSKRRKVPKGVEFDEDQEETESDSDSGASNKAKNGSRTNTPKKKTIKSESSQGD